MKLLASLTITFFINQIVYSQINGHYGGKTPTSQCIDQSHYQIINTSKLKYHKSEYSRDAILFDDPMGNGGLNSFGKTVTNYVDLNPDNSLLDYNCGQITYNTHQGTDIEILNFYEMDDIYLNYEWAMKQ